MATLYDLLRVQGVCACSRSCPISQLYFCRHCYSVRCGNCVSHEIDSHYCPNCLENMTSAEAKMRKHRCGNCFDCPSCGHTLSTRGTFSLAPTPGGDSGGNAASTPQKTYYLLCSFCRWSTRDSSIPDQNAPSGGWHETNNPHTERIEKLIAAYRQVAVREKNERERSKYVRKRNYTLLMLSLAEKYPVLTPRFRRCRSSNWSAYGREIEPPVEVSIPRAEAEPITASFNVDEFVGKPLQFKKVTSPFQRHMTPSLQPARVEDLEPRHKALAVKRSLRCKQCEHTLSKADFNPSSIKFRINLSAVHHVPDLRFSIPAENLVPASIDTGDILTPPLLPTLSFSSAPPRDLKLTGFSQKNPTNVVLTLSNPAHRITTVRLRQLTAEEEGSLLDGFFAKTRDPVNKESILTCCYSTATIDLPVYGIKVAARNDASEYNDLIAMDNSNEFLGDDAKLIAFRRGNKVGIKAGVRLNQASPSCQHLRVALMMTFDYINTTASAAAVASSVALLSVEHRTATANAVMVASGLVDSLEGGGVGACAVPVGGRTGPGEEDTRDVNIIYLVDFGSC